MICTGIRRGPSSHKQKPCQRRHCLNFVTIRVLAQKVFLGRCLSLLLCRLPFDLDIVRF
jgi:hypothetical protein